MKRALELAERGRSTTHPNPVVGAVLVRDGEVVGEGWHERKGGPHGEIVALDAAGERARGATLYVTMEPCAHHGTTPPCTDALIAAGVTKVVAGSRDPNPEAAGGFDVLRAAGIEVEDADSFAARAQNEAWRTWVTRRRPFVLLKLALTLDGRVAVPGSRWISGEESRRRVHELRAQVDAVAVGMGTVRADAPQLTARDVDAARQPRRLAFGHGPTELELRSGTLDDELRALADEGVQSLLLEGGPTLAGSFLRAGLVDKVLLFVAPRIAGEGLLFAPELGEPIALTRPSVELIGDDLFWTAYVHEPR
jgi:diaminohydroxyphosphoribosylaminopyrimidine deaminase / 5-amino-6-(5-phosphoribosylamino)uracil reductase